MNHEALHQLRAMLNHGGLNKEEPGFVLSCGCKSHDLGISAEWESSTRDCQPATAYGQLCKDCFKAYGAKAVSAEEDEKEK